MYDKGEKSVKNAILFAGAATALALSVGTAWAGTVGPIAADSIGSYASSGSSGSADPHSSDFLFGDIEGTPSSGFAAFDIDDFGLAIGDVVTGGNLLLSNLAETITPPDGQSGSPGTLDGTTITLYDVLPTTEAAIQAMAAQAGAQLDLSSGLVFGASIFSTSSSTLDFTLTQAGVAAINAELLADPAGVFVFGVAVPLSGGSNSGFTQQFISASGAQLSLDFTAAPVPSPAAAGGGLAMLSMLTLRRRRAML